MVESNTCARLVRTFLAYIILHSPLHADIPAEIDHPSFGVTVDQPTSTLVITLQSTVDGALQGYLYPISVTLKYEDTADGSVVRIFSVPHATSGPYAPFNINQPYHENIHEWHIVEKFLTDDLIGEYLSKIEDGTLDNETAKERIVHDQYGPGGLELFPTPPPNLGEDATPTLAQSLRGYFADNLQDWVGDRYHTWFYDEGTGELGLMLLNDYGPGAGSLSPANGGTLENTQYNGMGTYTTFSQDENGNWIETTDVNWYTNLMNEQGEREWIGTFEGDWQTNGRLSDEQVNDMLDWGYSSDHQNTIASILYELQTVENLGTYDDALAALQDPANWNDIDDQLREQERDQIEQQTGVRPTDPLDGGQDPFSVEPFQGDVGTGDESLFLEMQDTNARLASVGRMQERQLLEAQDGNALSGQQVRHLAAIQGELSQLNRSIANGIEVTGAGNGSTGGTGNSDAASIEELSEYTPNPTDIDPAARVPGFQAAIGQQNTLASGVLTVFGFDTVDLQPRDPELYLDFDPGSGQTTRLDLFDQNGEMWPTLVTVVAIIKAFLSVYLTIKTVTSCSEDWSRPR